MNPMKSRIKIKVDIMFLTLAGMVVFFLTVGIAQGQPQVNADAESGTFKSGASYTAENFRDPFANPIQPEVSPDGGESNIIVPELPPPDMKIQGIFWGGKFPQAIINDKVVKINEKIDGAQVIEITKDSVKILFGNKQFVLSAPAKDNLESSFNKKTAEKGGNK